MSPFELGVVEHVLRNAVLYRFGIKDRHTVAVQSVLPTREPDGTKGIALQRPRLNRLQ
jgi:hypothetical protein